MVSNTHLVWIMHQGTIITLITNSITICITLVCVIDVRTIISFIKNVYEEKKKGKKIEKIRMM